VNAKLRIDVVTIFPSMFRPILDEGVIAKAIERGEVVVNVHDLRDSTTDRHRSTDDEAYGGGAGMVMLAEPVFRCHDAIRASDPAAKPHVVLMSPQGRTLDQKLARDLAARRWLVLLCGRYEGIDERVREAIVDEEVSVGDFVVTGGEIPAMLVIDSVTRMIEGVVGCRNSVEDDSFYNGLLDYPHYTRPAEVRGMKVPEVLISGHFEKIRKWRKEQALRATLRKRPDLLGTAELDPEARKILDSLRAEESGETKKH
jgi:tRNA (guanine37-N1)-methyltransferase